MRFIAPDRPIVGAAFVGMLSALALVSPGLSGALTPPAPEQAEIFYSNGGRILSVKADGSERQVIASRPGPVENTDLGFAEPAVSPDGQQLAFVHRRKGETPYFRADVMVSGTDGSEPTRVLAGSRNHYYSSPGWTPDGEHLIAAFYSIKGWKQTGGIVSVKPDGSDRRVILKLKTRIVKNDWSSAAGVASPVISPDGRKVMFVRLRELIYDQEGALVVADLAGGKTRVIARYSSGGSWSPDGRRIVHAERTSGDDEVCGPRRCEAAGKLFILNADGSGKRKLVGGKGFELAPDWSDDGSRIVFQSNRNLPESAGAWELYSVAPDRSCLTWLTNGAPVSTDPDWSVGPGEETYPDGCGANGRPVLNEIPKPGEEPEGLAPRFWLGENFNGLLVSNSFVQAAAKGLTTNYAELTYGDCAWYEPASCGSPVQTFEFPVCSARNSVAEGILGSNRVRIRRGVPHFRSTGDGTRYDWFVTGRSVVAVWREASVRKPTGAQIIAGLTPLDAPEGQGKLPAMELPRSDIERMERVVAVTRRTGSVKRTARRLSMKPATVRANRLMSRIVSKVAPVRTINCGKKKGDS